jgi:hypothetical protein
MQDKIAKATLAAIETLQIKIAALEEELKLAKADLEIKQEILRVATYGSPEGDAK